MTQTVSAVALTTSFATEGLRLIQGRDSRLRLFTAVLQDQHDEWQDGRRHFSQQSMARVLHPDGPALLTNALTEGTGRLIHRRCENSTEFTPLPGT